MLTWLTDNRKVFETQELMSSLVHGKCASKGLGLPINHAIILSSSPWLRWVRGLGDLAIVVQPLLGHLCDQQGRPADGLLGDQQTWEVGLVFSLFQVLNLFVDGQLTMWQMQTLHCKDKETAAKYGTWRKPDSVTKTSIQSRIICSSRPLSAFVKKCTGNKDLKVNYKHMLMG